LIGEGIAALQKALSLNSERSQAVAFLSLLYRCKADIAETTAEREEFTHLANDLLAQHKEVRERRLEHSDSSSPKNG
jgi:hypothetical protein